MVRNLQQGEWALSCAHWVNKCRRSDLDEIFKTHGPNRLNKSHRICAKHFKTSDFRNPKLTNQGDIRPGLVHSQSMKRKLKIEKKHLEANKKHYNKPLKQLEEEKRTEGLNSALSSTNKGFVLMQKMGYKPGMAIGKQTKEVQEPIKVAIKSDRGGLGRETEIKEKTEKWNALLLERKANKEKDVANIQINYQQHIRNKYTMKYIQRDLLRSQRICEQFDKENGIETPSEPWFWIPVQQEEDEDDDDDDDKSEEEKDEDVEENVLDPSDKLMILTAYLRKTYLYCIWCGTKFDDENDMQQNCPGNTKEDHD